MTTPSRRRGRPPKITREDIARAALALGLEQASIRSVAAELGVSVDTLGRWAASGKGPKWVRAGRKVLYRRRAVVDWLQKQEEPPVKPAPKKRGRK